MRELVRVRSRGNGDALLRSAWVLSVPEKRISRRAKKVDEGSVEREREREWKGPLSMYEAINLARQIASSLVRSQANC